VKKLLALAGLTSVLALPCAAFADNTNDTSCTNLAQAETIVLSCTPIADPEAYYYAGPDAEDMTFSPVPVEENAENVDALENAVSFVAFVPDIAGN
jgi:hypothetical protein